MVLVAADTNIKSPVGGGGDTERLVSPDAQHLLWLCLGTDWNRTPSSGSTRPPVQLLSVLLHKKRRRTSSVVVESATRKKNWFSVFWRFASSCVSIRLPDNIITELTTRAPTQLQAVIHIWRHPNSCPPLRPPVFFLPFDATFLPPSHSAEARGKQLDSAGCCRGKEAKKQTNQRGLIVF